MDLRPGAVIAGRYRLERKIGAGGMGEVWSAEHIAIGVRVALKTLLPGAAVDQQLVARFRREAYLLGRLRSDRVARVVDFIEDRRYGLVLVMDFVEGESLATVLEQRHLSVEEGIDLAVDIVTALCDLHRAKVVHRDLKPDNIILEPKASGRRRAVIVDFGVSRMETGPTENEADEEGLTAITQADVAVGTIPYMAPEQFLSSRDVTGAADLYAVGAILFRALTGDHVFGDAEDMDYARKKLTKRAPPLVLPRFDRVARGLIAVVGRALERLPDARFESADAMLAELSALHDLARATALDLEAATEAALPPSIGDLPPPDTQVDDPAEPTRRMSRPPGLELLEESTLDSPGAAATKPPSAPPPTQSSATRSAPSLTPGPSTGSRATVPSPGIDAPPPSEPSPEPSPVRATAGLAETVSVPVMPRVARTFSARALVIGIVAALLAGSVLGFEVHSLFVR